MKRYMVLFLVFALCLPAATGCGAAELAASVLGAETPAETPQAPLMIPNPLREVEGPADFLPLGVAIDAPAGAEDVRYTVIANTIAEVDFTHSGAAVTLRAAKGEDDISGIYMNFDKTEQLSLAPSGTAVTVSATAAGETLALWQKDGISYSLFAEGGTPALVPALVSAVSGETLSAPESAPESSALPAEPIPFLAEEGESAIAYDIDGDGREEQVTLLTLEGEYETTYTVIRITDDTGSTYTFGPDEADMPEYATVLLLADILPGDSCTEIVLSGDMCSTDYITHILRFDGTKIEAATSTGTYDGSVLAGIWGSFFGMGENGSIFIDNAVDALGTFWGIREYAHEGGMHFGYAPGSSWVRLYDGPEDIRWGSEYSNAITALAPLPVTVEGEACTLEAGTELFIVETDRESFADFLLQDGRRGRIELTWPEDEWRAFIDGRPEDEWFEYLPYAG